MPPETDNLRLEELYQADQQERQKVYDSAQAVQELKHRDGMRKTLVLEMMSKGEVVTANDYYRAAVLLQHGDKPQDFLAAHRLAVMAAIRGLRPARWLAAASLDRFLMAAGFPQVYGTQFEHNAGENRYQLRSPMDDSSLLGQEKEFFGIPTVARRLEQLNGRLRGA